MHLAPGRRGLAVGARPARRWASDDSIQRTREARLVRVEDREADRFSLQRGRHPDDRAFADGGESLVPSALSTPHSERPVARARRAKTQELVERLVIEGHVRFTDSDDVKSRYVVSSSTTRTARRGTGSKAHRDSRCLHLLGLPFICRRRLKKSQS